jgi:hypothetical protein
VEADPEPTTTDDGAAGNVAAGVGAAPPALTVGGIPGAAAGAPVREEGALTRAIIRCPASQWPGTPLMK